MAGLVALVAASGGCSTLNRPTADLNREIQTSSIGKLERSKKSRELEAYYAKVQSDLLTNGLLRTDGGGPDAPFTASLVEHNFVQLAFYDEYARGKGFQRGTGEAVHLRKWTSPVRITTEFGAGIDLASQRRTESTVRKYIAKLATVTGHPISISRQNANFHVFFMGEDDRERLITRIREIIPNINQESIDIIDLLPRSIHCLVFAFSGTKNRFEYSQAIALVRNEHPELLRTSCIHEEVAQGLGLANDSPLARPSIFNDDDEFATLTRQDVLFLKILYHPRLHPGMSLDTALPIIRDLAPTLVNEVGS